LRRNLLWAALVVTTALVQTTWLGALRVAGVLPDLVLLLVVYFALAEGEERAMFTGVLGGLFQDVAGNAALGHHVLCLVIVGYATGRITLRLVTEHPAIKVGLVFCASLANGLLYATIGYGQRPDVGGWLVITAQVIPGAFYTALVTPLIFVVLERCFRRGQPGTGRMA
jgi:rod shape-determining protein MreD